MDVHVYDPVFIVQVMYAMLKADTPVDFRAVIVGLLCILLAHFPGKRHVWHFGHVTVRYL